MQYSLGSSMWMSSAGSYPASKAYALSTSSFWVRANFLAELATAVFLYYWSGFIPLRFFLLLSPKVSSVIRVIS